MLHMGRLTDNNPWSNKAFLRSPLFTPSEEETCLHMDVFKGPIRVIGNQLGNKMFIFDTSDNFSNSWISLNLSVASMVNRIEISANSDEVAIDNISLERRPCQGMFFHIIACQFKNKIICFAM